MKKGVCDYCGMEVEEDWLLCPNCGAKLHGKSRRFTNRIWLKRLLLSAVLLILVTLGSGGAGIYQGLRERDRLIREAAAEHYAMGVAHLEEGACELAIAEFEYTLRLIPDYRDTEDKLAEAKARLQAMGTPSLEAQSQLTAALYEEAQTLYRQGKWGEAIHKLEQLRSLDLHYKRQEVEELLYASLFKYGLWLVDEERLEEALSSFDKALELKPDASEVSLQRDLAALYLNVLSYWGADWEKSIENLTKLYEIAPNYKDVKQRLYEAYVNLGDVYANRGEWCSAEEQYAKAVQLRPDQACEEKRVEANRLCLAGTPSSPAASTVTPSGPIAGFNLGKIAFTIYDEQGKVQGIYVLYADGLRQVEVAEGASQPAFGPDGKRIAFRAERDGQAGIWTMDIESGEEAMAVDSIGGIHPTWAPDGQKIAFAICDDEDRWHIYSAPANGGSEAEEIALGWSPAWGPEGLFAYNGCGEESDDCGIRVVKEGANAPLRLTSDPHDIGLAWSPDGRQLAYMSDHDGDWNIYMVTVPEGYVSRLTDDPARDVLPAWSPDGRHIAFVSDRNGAWGVYLMESDGSQQRKIFSLGAAYPNWLEDCISWAR